MPRLQGALAGTAGSGDFAVKALLTVLALGFGFKGGEMTPMFTIGALLGCALGQLHGRVGAVSGGGGHGRLLRGGQSLSLRRLPHGRRDILGFLPCRFWR